MNFKTSFISHQDFPHVSWLVGLDDRDTDGTLGCEMPLMAVQRTPVKASEAGPVSDWYGFSLKCWCCLMNELWISHLPPLFMDYGLICCLISYFQCFSQYISISLCSSFLSFCFFPYLLFTPDIILGKCLIIWHICVIKDQRYERWGPCVQ